jgi:hypothetical protein
MNVSTEGSPYLAADDPCFPEEGTVNSETFDRDIESLLTIALDADPDKRSKTTWVLSDGRYIGPEWVPQRLIAARKSWLDSGRDPDLFWIVAGLLEWAGRDPNSPEEREQLRRLREQAQQLLGVSSAA